MRKILFLDVNGVLDDRETLENALVLGSFYAVGEKQLSLLKQIVDETSCEIVLTSQWRLHHETQKFLAKAFHKIGIDHRFDATPEINGAKRRDEILKWINNNIDSETVAVVLDDDHDAVLNEQMKNITISTVLTYDRYGLMEKECQEVISAFGVEACRES